MGEAGLPAVRYLLLDFRLVSGIDSSALLGFVKMRKLAESQSAGLIFVHTPPEIRAQLENNGIREGEGVVVRWFPELDRAVEWCEDQILLARAFALEEPHLPLAERLARVLVSVETPRLMHYLERMEVPAGHLLMRQDDPADDVYLVESGRVTAQMELGDGTAVRLLTMGAGCGGRPGGALPGHLPHRLGDHRDAEHHLPPVGRRPAPHGDATSRSSRSPCTTSWRVSSPSGSPSSSAPCAA